MTYKHIKCPNCGAPLTSDSKLKTVKCEYCDSLIDFSRNMSIAEKIKKMEIEESAMIRQEEIKQKEKEIIEEKKSVKGKIVATVILSIIGLTMVISGYYFGEKTTSFMWLMIAIIGFFPLISIFSVWDGKSKKEIKEIKAANKGCVVIDDKLFYTEDDSYSEMKAKFKSAGFTNIECCPLKDLNFLKQYKNGLIKSIVIDGDEYYGVGDVYEKDAPVVITYHSTK